MPDLIGIQDEIRADFGWGLEADLESARGLREACGIGWPEAQRARQLLRIQERLIGQPLTVLGAAVEPEQVIRALDRGHRLVAADGAVGVLGELSDVHSERAWARLVCVVSDADGAPGDLMRAARRGIPFALHAHGDNAEAWEDFLESVRELDLPLVLTHQTPNALAGMLNPGGFTDGDRAVCLALHLDVRPERLHLAGFRTDVIGRWTGATHPERKVRKLIWMARILDRVGVPI